MNRNFLERAGLGYMAEQFSVNKITGKCLMLLTEVGLNDIWDMLILLHRWLLSMFGYCLCSEWFFEGVLIF